MTYKSVSRLTTVPIARLRYRPFHLKLTAPIETAHGTIEERTGVILELQDTSGNRGIGEASPIALHGEGTVEDVLRLIKSWVPSLFTGNIPEIKNVVPGANALSCALDSAMLDLQGQRLHLPLAALAIERPIEAVAVNAVIGSGPLTTVQEQVRLAIDSGYKTLKLKVGVGPLEEDYRHVEAVREVAPNVHLRLDANGAWDTDTATEALQELSQYHLEYLEQPVPANDLAGMRQLRSLQLCRIAADESVSTIDTALNVLRMGATDILVLKPMRLGGIRPALELAHRATSDSVDCVVTTNFDSSIGVAASLQLAASLPNAGLAHGLSTASHLAADLVINPLLPNRGMLRLPSTPGIGLELDEAALEIAATDDWTTHQPP